MKLVYVAGPYRGKTWGEVIANVGRASDVTAELLRLGHAVLCPHTMTHTFEMYDLDDEVFLVNGIEQLKRCDAVVLVVQGKAWYRSSGTVAEVREAMQRGIPVYTSPAALQEANPVCHEALEELTTSPAAAV